MDLSLQAAPRAVIDDPLKLGGATFRSRLLVGTGKFASQQKMLACLSASAAEMVTVALKRVNLGNIEDDIYTPLKRLGLKILPNTSGARDAEEALKAAKIAQAALDTSWIKLEIHPDPRHLLPDNLATLRAAEKLCRAGFKVLPYCAADPILCRQLEEAGCAAIMPLGSPIGSNKGLRTRDFIHIIIAQSSVPVIIDAGLGRPSDACLAMEFGADAVLVNTALATSANPEVMGEAFGRAVRAGRLAFRAGVPLAGAPSPSSPVTEFNL